MAGRTRWALIGMGGVMLMLTAGGCAQNNLEVQRDQLLKQNQQLQAQLAETKADLTATQTQLTQAQQAQAAAAQQQAAAASQPAENDTTMLPAFKGHPSAGEKTAVSHVGRHHASHRTTAGSLHRFVLSSDLLFVSGGAHLHASADRHLLHVARLLKTRYAGRKIRIEGFTDPRPIHHRFSSNYALGLARAKAVEQFLAHHGVSRSRMKAVSYGARHLVSRKNLALDRRVEIVVLR